MITRIIVPTDGSDHAAKACELAGDIAAKYDAEVTILHVLMSDASIDQLQAVAETYGADDDVKAEIRELVDLPLEAVAYGGDTVPVMTLVPQSLLMKIGQLITAGARELVSGKGVETISVQIVGGRPADAIIEAAERNGCDMIVMGSRGFGDLKGLFMGSVSHKVSNLSEITCVTVK
jgi:nucleotide-binding universal stress UspA family protein